MYTISCDGNLLYSPLLSDGGYTVLSPKLTLELNKAGSLTFTLPPTNPMYDSISKLTSVITVDQDGETIWRGRELNYTRDFYNRKAEYCEGELAMLNDSIIRPYSFGAVTPGAMFLRLTMTRWKKINNLFMAQPRWNATCPAFTEQAQSI